MSWIDEVKEAVNDAERDDDAGFITNIIILGLRLFNAMGSFAFGVLLMPIWIILGLLTAITIVGFPLSMDIFRMCAFWTGEEYEVYFSKHTIANSIWRCTFGAIMSVVYALIGIASCACLMFIPLGQKYFKKIRLVFTPFGADIF